MGKEKPTQDASLWAHSVDHARTKNSEETKKSQVRALEEKPMEARHQSKHPDQTNIGIEL